MLLLELETMRFLGMRFETMRLLGMRFELRGTPESLLDVDVVVGNGDDEGSWG